MNELILIDASCMAYLIEAKLAGFNATDPQVREAMVAWVNERLWLNTANPCRVLWLLDSPPYWRSLYEPDYKGQRGARELDPTPCLNLIRSFPNAVAVASFEADDLAGWYCRNATERVWLLTTDSDWQGLISESVTMLSPIHEPRVRGKMEVWGWLSTRAKTLPKKYHPPYKMPQAINFDCAEIWAYKARFGDTGDNLPPGTARGLIDLLNPLQPIPAPLPNPEQFTAIAYNYSRAADFMRALPDLPFNPLRIGHEQI